MSMWKIHHTYTIPFTELAPNIPRSVGAPTGPLYVVPCIQHPFAQYMLLHPEHAGNTESRTLRICTGEDFSPKARDAVYHLYNMNMTPILEGTTAEYGEDSKRRELFSPRSIFLLLLDKPLSSPLVDTVNMPGALPRGSQGGQINRIPVVHGALCNIDFHRGHLMGYCSFRFDTEETLGPRLAEVIYCYELQLKPEIRGMGLAQMLIETLEAIGQKAKMQKSMLTCAKKNEKALRFYTKMGYALDEIDPTRMAEEDSEDEDADWEEVGSDGEPVEREPPADYVILSKDLPYDEAE